MKVAILAKTITPWQNGNLLYEEALRQGRDVLLVKQENTLSDIYIALSQYEPDFILLTGSRKKLELYKIAKSVAPVAIWDADNADSERLELWDRLEGLTDLIFTSIKGLEERLRVLAPRVEWVPQYYDQNFLEPTVDRLSSPSMFIYDLCFFGGKGDERRDSWRRTLGESKNYYTLFTGGSYPPKASQGALLANYYANSKIALGIERSHPFLFSGTSDRIFKATGCGAFYLTYNFEGLGELFEIGREIALYNGTYEDLVKKIDYYLANPEEREEIALRGQARTLRDHTITTRLSQYWEKMEACLEKATT